MLPWWYWRRLWPILEGKTNDYAPCHKGRAHSTKTSKLDENDGKTMKSLTPEMIEKAKVAKSAEELLELAKANGVAGGCCENNEPDK